MSRVSEEQLKQYRDHGFMILENVVPEHHLEGLRAECARAIRETDAEMDRLGVDTLFINHRNKRYFAPFLSQNGSVPVRQFLFSEVMADIAQSVLGPNVFLFLDQYVVKCNDKDSRFGWHQDSGYGGFPHRPYLTCWIPLDDVTIQNGTVYILPFERAPNGSALVEHIQDPELNDMVGYFGEDPGDPIEIKAGSMACFQSVTFHRSGPNTTDQLRRVFLAQYTDEVLLNAEGTKPWILAEPFVRDGSVVATP